MEELEGRVYALEQKVAALGASGTVPMPNQQPGMFDSVKRTFGFGGSRRKSRRSKKSRKSRR